MKVDSIVKKYSSSFANPDKLADLINETFFMPEEKARAIYTWIALNIEYDVRALKKKTNDISYSYSSEEERIEKERKIFEDLAKQTIKKKKAVCQGYSTLFKYLCDKAGVECVIVYGASKTNKYDIGKMPKEYDHAWNAVRINNEWKLIDVTWGAGYVIDDLTKFIPEFKDFYFFLAPEKFALKHYPKESEWLLTTISADEFANSPLFFSSYFESDIEVINPKNGIIKLLKKENLRIIVKNNSNGILSFKFDNEKSSQLISPKKENELLIYELGYKKSANTYLTVYLNDEAFMILKITK
jgi:transglutaminase/protease-like cytokinesis protein 3